MTGWNLPPGVTTRMIDEAAGVYDRCEVCGEAVDHCICHECTVCGEIGNKLCYAKHSQIMSLAQIISYDWNEALTEAEQRDETEFFRHVIEDDEELS